MARPRKTKPETETQAPPPAGHNGPMPADDVVRNFTARVEKLHDELDTEKGEYMRRCRSIRDDIKNVLVEASDAGVPRREFKAVIKVRLLEKRADAVRDELEPDEAETFDTIRTALGDYSDTPLGQAALAKAPDRPAA